MRVGVIDAGATALRLLVAEAGTGGLARVHAEHRRLPLALDIERHGQVMPGTLATLADTAAAQAQRARTLGAERLQVLVGSAARMSRNAEELRRTLQSAARAHVRVLSGEEEGLLAYRGALLACRRPAKSLTVCDVGGASTQLVFGTPAGAAWARSVELGSLTLGRRLPGDPPGPRAVAAACAEAARRFDGIAPPPAKQALAVGGTARAAGRLVGEQLGRRELIRAVELLSRRSLRETSSRFRLPPGRVETLLSGVLILLEVQRRVGLPLRVVPGGVREGAAGELLVEQLAA